MSKKIQHKDGTLYYRQNDLWRLIGAGMMIVGVVWFYFGWSAASYYVPCVITPAGLILFLVFSSRHISDNDMEEEKNHRLTDYDTCITGRQDYHRYVLRQPASVETDAYHMGADAAYFKRGKNSTLVSDRFVKSHFFFTNDALLVCSRTLSLTLPREEEGAFEDVEVILPFSDIRSAELCEQTTTITLTNTKKPASAKWTELLIMGDSEELLRLPVKNDMDMFTLCEEINRKVKNNR